MFTGCSFFPELEHNVSISDGLPMESSLIVFIVLHLSEIEKQPCPYKLSEWCS